LSGENAAGGETLRALLTTLIKQMAELKEQVCYNTRLLHDVVRRQRGTYDKEKSGGQPPFDLPLTSYDAVLAVEQQLKSKETYSQLVSQLFNICDIVMFSTCMY